MSTLNETLITEEALITEMKSFSEKLIAEVSKRCSLDREEASIAILRASESIFKDKHKVTIKELIKYINKNIDEDCINQMPEDYAFGISVERRN